MHACRLYRQHLPVARGRQPHSYARRYAGGRKADHQRKHRVLPQLPAIWGLPAIEQAVCQPQDDHASAVLLPVPAPLDKTVAIVKH
jgi:hypothetical protein